MKRIRRIVSTLLIAVLFTAAALVPEQAIQAKEPTAKEILVQMQKKLNSVKGYEATANTDINMKISVLGESETMSMKMVQDMTQFMDPLKAKMTLKMDMKVSGETQKETSEIYYEKKGKQLVMYTKESGKWSKRNISLEDFEEDVLGMNVAEYGSDLVKAKLLSSNEKVGSKEAYLISGTITGESMKDLMEASGALDAAGSEINMDSFKNLKGFTVKYWVDKKTMYPIKATVDMKGFMQSIMEGAMEEALGGEDMSSLVKIDISKCLMTMTFKNINKAKDFKIPAAALKA